MNKSVDYNIKVLEVSHLKQHFKVGVGRNKLKVKAVDDISFDVYKKEVFGLVGESGCGKTTTGRTIIRLYRPTNGLIKLNGKIIGAGVNDFYRDLKYRKKEYHLDLLKVNKYKYDVHIIKEETSKQNDIYIKETEALKNDFNQKKSELEKGIYSYKEAIFNEKNNFATSNERIIFDYVIKKEKIINRGNNEFLVEYKELLKGFKKSLQQKLEGLKESAALSKEQKEFHKKSILEKHQEKIDALEQEFKPKIEERNKKLVSKEEIKKELSDLKEKLNADKLKLRNEHTEYIINLKKPDYETIRKNVELLKLELYKNLSVIKEKMNKLKISEKERIDGVVSLNAVDKEKLESLRSEYQNFVLDKKIKIKEARKLQNSEDAETRVKDMQMIFQDPISSLNPRMTVQEIISEGLVINGEKDKNVIKSKVLEALDLVGLSPDYITRYPHEFSGGQRQRIGIARALIMNPSVIIADEPISALDVSIKAQVINLLTELKDNLDLSILFIAHDLSVVKFFCDRIAVMYFGKMVELTTSEELFKRPLHGYTKSLLSAIPHPDPDYEKVRVRENYNPMLHDYSIDKPEFVEVFPGHFVLANKAEVAMMKKDGGKK